MKDSKEITAHCANTGSMLGCSKEGDTIYLSYHPDTKRKLKYSWELSKTSKGYIGINTHRSNLIVCEGIEKGLIKELKGYAHLKREVKFSDSRLDIHLSAHKENKKNCWVEVKNVTMLKDNKVMFPDAVSLRAIKHLKTLMEIVKKKERAVIFYLINRPEGEFFTTADHICKDYRNVLKEAIHMGVEVMAYRSHNTLEENIISDKVKISL